MSQNLPLLLLSHLPVFFVLFFFFFFLSADTPGYIRVAKEQGTWGHHCFGLGNGLVSNAIPNCFQDGYNHKCRIHQQNMIELAFNLWRGLFPHVHGLHKLRLATIGAVRFQSFIRVNTSDVYKLGFSTFRIKNAITYAGIYLINLSVSVILINFVSENWSLVDFAIPEIENDWLARVWLVNWTKFIRMQTLPKWCPADKKINKLLIINSLLAKEIKFGPLHCPVSSAQLAKLPDSRERLGDLVINSELDSDRGYKGVDVSTSKRSKQEPHSSSSTA
jgi:hypothetical protein